jgi:hypothetical protein
LQQKASSNRQSIIAVASLLFPRVYHITTFKPLSVAQFHRHHAPVYPLQTTDNGQRNTRWQSNESTQAIEKQTIIVLQPRS